MSKPVHYAVLVAIVLICASLSAFTVHKILTISGMGVNNQNLSRAQEGGNTNPSTAPVEYLKKDRNGVYILPTINPTYPLQLGPHTVGGVTACERLHNLSNCLRDKKSPLVNELRTPEASPGAGLETVCSSILNDLAQLRPQTAQIGCVW